MIFRDALIMDGVGAEPYHADLAVDGDRIAAIGTDLGWARQTVDADGLALMPGIIDGHTHYDAQVTWDPFVDPSPALGVTSVVMGNCGFTIAPCRPEDRDLTMRNLTHVEGMSLDALRAGIDWGFETFPEYLAMLEARGVGPNVAAFVGHSSVRTYVLRDEASRRAATDAEIEEMAAIVRAAMRAGAVGFSSTTNEPHNGENGVPMPSRLADRREMEALTGAMGEGGRGVFMTTKGACTSISELEALAARCGRPALVSGFLHNPANPNRAQGFLDEIAAARARGVRMWGEVSCCPLTMDFTMRSAYIFEGLPAWKPAMEAKGAALSRVYADAAFRESVKRDLVKFRGLRAFNSEWHKLHIVETALRENATLEGRSIEELAAMKDAPHPLDALLDLALQENLDTLFTAVLLNSDERSVAPLVNDPDNYVTLSDAGAHLTFLCDAGFGLHLLGRWSRELKVMSMAEAVRKLTTQPAAIFGIHDRGRLAPGLAADLFLFDPATVGRGPKSRRRDLPGGGARLVTPGIGVHGVWVNGRRLVDAHGGVSTAERPGRVLRDFA
ncbi:MAG: amidohydrolase family protein [Rhodospirillales bacterium]|nr:MAG: amidohydrolase family protein [Rhodospirillales bacterium]